MMNYLQNQELIDAICEHTGLNRDLVVSMKINAHSNLVFHDNPLEVRVSLEIALPASILNQIKQDKPKDAE